MKKMVKFWCYAQSGREFIDKVMEYRKILR